MQTQTIAFVTEKFYFEFQIVSDQDVAYITKRAFKGTKFNDQSTKVTVQQARDYYAKVVAEFVSWFV